ncbi:MAG: glycoside hydrolase family 15 protein [Acidobacteria bacterium]|nr:glycoside hydrolase family 15 protein [Acidobacteriota bacterium]
MPLRIEDYGLIGDCETAALVGCDGSIDWLCFPRFDSGACFAALLGTPENGRWQLAPAEEVVAVRRRYRPGTLVLETEMETAHGVVAIIDWMPLRDVTSTPDVMRIVEGRRGKVPMHMHLTIRFDYGWVVPWVRRTRLGDLRATAGPDSLLFHAGAEFHGEGMHTVADFTVSEGDRIPFMLTWFPTYSDEPPRFDPEVSLRETEAWWRKWSGRCSYSGPWREAVVRSFVILKALTYRPTGGVVAAPTTSLPELIGGTRNWDYRYCWIRDATFTLYALVMGGYIDETCAWREWLVNTVAGRPSELHLMYGLAGERRLPELELDWLAGYEESRPVRIGNAAHRQFQLDVYGEMMDAMYAAERSGLPPSGEAWRIELALLRFLEEGWKRPDHGIWEMRGPRRHFTHSKVMAWVAFDRGIKLVEEFGHDGPVDRWRQIRAEIHEEVCREGFHPGMNTFVQYYGARHTDASLLMLPVVGFLPADDPRVIGTVEAIQSRLTEDGFVHRYLNLPELEVLPPGEGAFLLCTFWLADNLALQGRREEAREIFEKLVGLCNDVGLLSEEYAFEERRLVGNFPQAFSHVGLINTARNLTKEGGPAQERLGTRTTGRR